MSKNIKTLNENNIKKAQHLIKSNFTIGERVLLSYAEQY